MSETKHSFHGEPLPQSSVRRIGEDPEAVLKRVFGFYGYRGIQHQAVGALLAQRDVLGLMSTGGGKSLCYQIPALVLPGVALVISPLLALMRDQADALRRHGVRAAALAGQESQSPEERSYLLRALIAGSLDIVYVSPERLSTSSFQSILQKLRISLIAIDEAHAVCEWGRDFRPSYLEIGCAIAAVDAPRIALTATASPEMARDIAARLLRPRPVELRTSFDRPNIFIHVDRVADPLDSLRRLLRDSPVNGSTLVYAPTRVGVEESANAARQWGLSALPYHAGLSDQIRSATQDDFLHGRVPIICATSAFGMGVDHSNVRRVVHLGLPSSLPAYYQEIGRAGRDGAPAEAKLFWTPADVARRTRIAVSMETEPRRREIARLETVLGYVETPSCRRSTLLRCFGDFHPGNCGGCDRCLSTSPMMESGALVRASVRLAKRLGEDSTVSVLAEGLAGALTARVRTLGVDRTTEFGAGKPFGLVDCRLVVRQCIGLGYLEVQESSGSAVATEHGQSLLTAPEAPVSLRDSRASVDTARASGLGERRDAYWQAIIDIRNRIPGSRLPDAIAVALVEALDDDSSTDVLLGGRSTDLIRAIQDARSKQKERRDAPATLFLDMF